jgi:hypothetical protein
LVLVPIPAPLTPIARIAILHDAAMIGYVDATPNPPTAAIVSPAGGETFASPTVTFDWTASDVDGGPLWSAVLYSADDGASWNTLAVDVTDTDLTIDRSALTASTTARVRVLVSDGVNVAMATSAQFTVTNTGPAVAILSPTTGQTFTGAETIQLEANAVDREDGVIGDSIQWSSSLDGVLGSGAELTLSASDLTPGTHTLTASATDTDLVTGSDAVTIQIVP